MTAHYLGWSLRAQQEQLVFSWRKLCWILVTILGKDSSWRRIHSVAELCWVQPVLRPAQYIEIYTLIRTLMAP